MDIQDQELPHLLARSGPDKSVLPLRWKSHMAQAGQRVACDSSMINAILLGKAPFSVGK